MYDSVNPAAIPTSAQLVAGYVSGRWTWTAGNWARFPNSVHVTIATAASVNNGVVLDVEQGDATPAQAPGWVATRRAAGVDPTVYCSASTWASVVAAFTNAHIPQPHYWIAAYPGGGPILPTLGGIQAVAHQYADPATSGGDYDLSIVADHWPGVDQETDMQLSDTYVDWAGNTQTVEGTLNHLDQKLTDLHNTLLNLQKSRVPGSTVELPVVPDGVMDTNNFAFQGLQGINALLAQVTALSGALSNDQAALLAAIKGIATGAVDIPTLAQTIVSTLPAQLAPADAAALLAALKTQLDK